LTDPKRKVTAALDLTATGNYIEFERRRMGLLVSYSGRVYRTYRRRHGQGGSLPEIRCAAQRSLVESASAFGITQAEIAAQLKISEPTLRKHFREESIGTYSAVTLRFQSLNDLGRARGFTACPKRPPWQPVIG
jgi:hypothetical protein